MMRCDIAGKGLLRRGTVQGSAPAPRMRPRAAGSLRLLPLAQRSSRSSVTAAPRPPGRLCGAGAACHIIKWPKQDTSAPCTCMGHEEEVQRCAWAGSQLCGRSQRPHHGAVEGDTARLLGQAAALQQARQRLRQLLLLLRREGGSTGREAGHPGQGRTAQTLPDGHPCVNAWRDVIARLASAGDATHRQCTGRLLGALRKG